MQGFARIHVLGEVGTFKRISKGYQDNEILTFNIKTTVGKTECTYIVDIWRPTDDHKAMVQEGNVLLVSGFPKPVKKGDEYSIIIDAKEVVLAGGSAVVQTKEPKQTPAFEYGSGAVPNLRF